MPRSCSEAKKIINAWYNKQIKYSENIIEEKVKEKVKEEVESLKETKQYRELTYAIEEYLKLFEDKKLIQPVYQLENILKDLKDDGASAEIYWRNRKNCDIEEIKPYVADIEESERARQRELLILEQYPKSSNEYKAVIKDLENYLGDIYEKV